MINSLLTSQTFSKLSQQPSNRLCFECGAPNPTWASLPNAVFLCLTCSGLHRSLGVNVSQIRSTQLDTWHEKQLQVMMIGGNQRLKEYFQSKDIYSNQFADKDWSWKWRTMAASYYRQTIRAQIDEKPYPPQPTDEELLQEDPNIQLPYPFNKQHELKQELTHQDDIIPDLPLNYSRQIQEEKPIDVLKQFILTKYQQTAEITKDTIHQIDVKLQDPQFQNDVKEFKQKVQTKSLEVKDQTQKIAKEKFNIFKEKTNYAWSFMKQKYQETIQKKPQEAEYVQNIQSDLSLIQSDVVYSFHSQDDIQNDHEKKDQESEQIEFKEQESKDSKVQESNDQDQGFKENEDINENGI